jgi:hypothetical protein
VASSSRARIARERSSCGTRVATLEDEGVGTRSSWGVHQQTVKPVF